MRFFPGRIAGSILAAVVYFMVARGEVDAQASWQASVSPVVALSVRKTSGAAYRADFALQSPKGKVRHAQVMGDAATGVAAIDFGGERLTELWGPPDEDFDAGLAGRWTWSCSVSGKIVAHGQFVFVNVREGVTQLTTSLPEFR